MTDQDYLTGLIYVGAFTRMEPHTRGRAEGISVYRMDPSTGRLTFASAIPGVSNPSFLTVDPRRHCLYAVNADLSVDGQPAGAVSAFAIDPASGALTFLNRQPSNGAGPCYVAVDPTGRFALATNFGSGSVVVLPIADDGRLGPATDFVQHSGSSSHPERQAGPHCHSVTLDPASRYALVCDLGLDQIVVYRFDLAEGKLIPNDPPGVSVRAGAGPRHLAFHPNARHVYVIDEIDSTITAFVYDAEHGTLQEFQTVSTLPAGFDGPNSCADIHVAPSGRFVYGSNRGHDSIVIFSIDEATGRLDYVGHESTLGQCPRNFTIDPTGTYLLVANQDSDSIVTFRVDGSTGRLAPTGHAVSTPTPTCLRLI